MNVDLFKLINKLVKYYVVCSSILMTIFCLCILLGYELLVIDLFVGLSLGGFICLYVTSYLLGYCWLYRNFLIHLFLVSSCITWHMYIGFGLLAPILQFIMFIYGIILILLLIKNRVQFNSLNNLIK